MVNHLGVEAISFIKLWFEIPVGFILVAIYCKLCNVYSAAIIFRLFVGGFLLFFTLFAFVVYPNQDFFHPNISTIDKLIFFYSNFKWFFVLWSKWSFAMFYIFSEFWPVIIYSLLFWQLANSTVSKEEAKVFYPYFSMASQLNLTLCGIIVYYFAAGQHVLSSIFSHSCDHTELTLKSVILAGDVLGLITILLHYLVEKTIKRQKEEKFKHSALLKLGLKESFMQIVTSRYLFFMCMIAMLYHMCVILIEGAWFSKVKEFYHTTHEFMQYQSQVLFWTGISGLIFAIAGKFIFVKSSWYKAAIITPSISLIFGALFFILISFKNQLAVFFHYNMSSLLGLIVVVGAIQNILIKGAKYGIGDPTKELLYFPLNKEMQSKGKAAVEILGTKLGKSLGSLTQFSIFTIVPTTTINDITSLLLAIFVCAAISWLLIVKQLSLMYAKKL